MENLRRNWLWSDTSIEASRTQSMKPIPSITHQGKLTETDCPGLDLPLRLFAQGEIILDQYEVIKELGRGGMGIVYKVYHRGWDTELAMKSLRLKDLAPQEERKKRFIAEAETWVNLELHPHIVSCYYVRILDDLPLLFAEYVAGGNLSDWIQKGLLYQGGPVQALERILDVAIQIAWGLHYAHKLNPPLGPLVHRDIKPANVMMLTNGTAKVTDFGLAKALAIASEEEGAIQKQPLPVSWAQGTFSYHSPEQDAKQALNHKTDIWSWGVSVLEMFVGQVTWENGSEARKVLTSHKAQKSAIPCMPTDVMKLLFHCFQPYPEDRPATMLDVATELQNIYLSLMGHAHRRQVPKTAEMWADSLNNRALSLLDLQRVENAKRLWKQAYEVDPQHLETTYNQGVVLWRLGAITDDALIRQMESLRHIQYQHWLPAYLLAQIHLERGDREAAFPLLEDAVHLAPEKNEAQVLLEKMRAEQPINANTLNTSSDHTGITYSINLLRMLQGHEGAAQAVSLSNDGRFAVSGSLDRTMQLWEVYTGRCLRVFQHKKMIYAVDISDDGRIVIVGSGKELWVWETGKKRRRYILHGHRETIRSVDLSADGRMAISGSSDTVCIWDIAKGRRLHTLKLAVDWDNPVGISNDGCLAITGSGNQGTDVLVWDTQTGHCLYTLQGHTALPSAVSLSLDGKLAISGSGGDETLRVWEVNTGRCLQTMRGHTHGIAAVELSTDGSLAISGSSDYTMRVWEVNTGRCLHTKRHSQIVSAVSLSADGSLVASGSLDKNVHIWQIKQQNMLCTLRLSHVFSHTVITETEAQAIHLLEQAEQALSEQRIAEALALLRELRALPNWECNPKSLEAWAKLTLHCSRTDFHAAWPVKALQEKAKPMCVSTDGRFVILAEGQYMHLWEIRTRHRLLTLKGHTNMVCSVSMSADGRLAVSSGMDNTVCLWDLHTGYCLHTMHGHTDIVRSVSMSADGWLAVSGGMDDTVRLWDLRTGRCLYILEGQSKWISTVSMSADGSVAASGGGKDTVRVWDLRTGHCLHVLERHEGVITSVKLSLDGRFVVSGSNDDAIRVWDLRTGQCQHVLEGPPRSIQEISLSTDGRWVASGGMDKLVHLWDIHTGRICTLPGPAGGIGIGIETVCLSVDGHTLFSGGYNGTLQQWELDWELAVREPADWDKSAHRYLENFLNLHTPYACQFPQDRVATAQEIERALTRRGIPTWTEQDFQRLLCQLRYVGYGWLRPEGIQKELIQMVEVRRITSFISTTFGDI